MSAPASAIELQDSSNPFQYAFIRPGKKPEQCLFKRKVVSETSGKPIPDLNDERIGKALSLPPGLQFGQVFREHSGRSPVKQVSQADKQHGHIIERPYDRHQEGGDQIHRPDDIEHSERKNHFPHDRHPRILQQPQDKPGQSGQMPEQSPERRV
jgi:hypothetical protein